MSLRTLLLTTVLCLAACETSGTKISERDIEHLQESASGIWASDGYGYVLDTRNGQQVYNRTEVYCAAIAEDEESPLVFFDKFQVDDKKTTLKLFHTFEPYPIKFTPITALPDNCLDAPPSNALNNFDAFASIFQTHYGFFDVHGVDWQQATQAARAGLSAESSEGELIEPMIGLLSGLRDGHVSISAVVDGDEGQFIAYPGPTNTAVENTDVQGRNPNSVFGEQYLRRDIEESILGGYGMDAVNERIKYGITSGDIGYIAIMGEGGFVGGADVSFEEELEALQPAMELMIETFNAKNVKAVIVDLSVNHGGYDFL